MDELTLLMSGVQELHSWGPVDNTQLNLEITAGILCTLDVVMIFWRSAVAIKDNNDFL